MRGVDRVVLRDGDAIGAMLTRLGAHDAVLAWEERRMRREVRATANRLANFDDANLRRSARAAVAAGARVQRALEILGDEVPDHLREAGTLRLEHKQASLEELGQLAQPPMTKDAVAGRIRRLLAMADKRASDLGIPGTDANLTPDMLSCVEHVGREVGLGAGDPEVLGALVGHRQQPPDPAGHGVLGHRRLGELAELLERRLLVLEPQRPGLAQVVGDLVAEDLHRPVHPGPGGDRGARRAAQVGVVEVGQPVGGGPHLAPHPALLPRQHGRRGRRAG